MLPLTNASGNADQEALADGLTEEIASALANVAGLNVGARSSAFRFKAPPRDLRAIGEQLQKTHLVEGSVQKTGDRVRLTARLVRAADGMQLWSGEYNGPFADIFGMQEIIAKEVASNLRVAVPANATLVRSRTTNMAAYEHYLRARPLIRARGPKPFADAAVLLEQAVAADPNFAPAAAMLAFDYDISPLYQASFRSGDAVETRRFVDSVIPKAERLARRATELEPQRAEGFVALAYANMVQRKMLAADDLFQKALALDPNQTDGLHGYSQLLAVEGRIKESLAMRLKLQALEPFVINYVADTALIYWLDKDDATAIKMLDEFRPGRTAEIAQIHSAMGKHQGGREPAARNDRGELSAGRARGRGVASRRSAVEDRGAGKPAASRQSLVRLSARGRARSRAGVLRSRAAGRLLPADLHHVAVARLLRASAQDRAVQGVYAQYRAGRILARARLAGALQARGRAGFHLRLGRAPRLDWNLGRAWRFSLRIKSSVSWHSRLPEPCSRGVIAAEPCPREQGRELPSDNAKWCSPPVSWRRRWRSSTVRF